jgi:hypothetical protein
MNLGDTTLTWFTGLQTTDELTLIGILIAVVGIVIAIFKLKRSNEIAKVQSWLTLRGLMANYDDIHANLSSRGKWHGSHDKPNTVEEWTKVETYLGLFGYCNELITSNLLDKRHFDHWFGYRVANLLSNPRIVTYKLHGYEQSNFHETTVHGYRGFRELCKRLERRIPAPAYRKDLRPFISNGDDPNSIPRPSGGPTEPQPGSPHRLVSIR